MKRVIKLEGKANIVVEEIEIPSIANNEVLVKNEKSLISRGSELFARYVMPNAVSPSIMGYSDAGIITAIGDDVKECALEQCVACTVALVLGVSLG